MAMLVFFPFDLLHLDGKTISAKPLKERKEHLRPLLSGAGAPLHFSDHQIGRGRAFYDRALKVEGIVSKRVDAPYSPGNRGLWLKVKYLNRVEFVVVGWTEPEGRRSFLGAFSPITIPTAGWLMPAAPPSASTPRNLNGSVAA